MREGNRGNLPGGVDVRSPQQEIDSVQVFTPDEDERDFFSDETSAQMLARDHQDHDEWMREGWTPTLTLWTVVAGFLFLLWVIWEPTLRLRRRRP